MIITPNIAIDNTHMNTFQNEFVTYENTPEKESTHYGSGDLEGCTIYIKKIRTLQGNGMYLAVTNKNEGILICRLIAAPVVQGTVPWGRKIYVMDRIRVHEDYVGRGLAPAIYRWLAEQGYTVMSDSHQNGNSLAIWKKLAKTDTVFMYNIVDNTWRLYNPTIIEDWVIFGNNDLSRCWSTRLILPGK
jgi:GNAT superfamily N-acetyltransferase